MILLPYSTDAPVYHWPYATVGLIVANVLIFVGVLSSGTDLSQSNPWILEYGNGLQPVQWVGSAFMHQGIIHLLSNMFFLWAFGIVVEGKIGWFRFLAIYLLIAIGESSLEQLIMLGYTGGGGSLGASTAIYGIMAIAAIWAPVNNTSFFYFIFFLLMGTFEVPVMGVAGFFIGLDIIYAVLTFDATSLLHIGGVVFGLPIGLFMLKNKRVDCEGWDIFSVNERNKPGASKRKKEREKAAVKKVDERKEKRQQQLADSASEQIHGLLLQGNSLTAFKLYDKLKETGDGISLSTEDLVLFIKTLHADKLYEESVPFMVKLIEAEPNSTDKTRISLAHICVARLDRPSYALELLDQVDIARLSPEKLKLLKQLQAKANQMLTEGVVEVDGPLVS